MREGCFLMPYPIGKIARGLCKTGCHVIVLLNDVNEGEINQARITNISFVGGGTHFCCHRKL